MKGLVIVAKLICQAKVEADQSGPKANNAELAMGFHPKNMELCKKARLQNSTRSNHRLASEMSKMLYYNYIDPKLSVVVSNSLESKLKNCTG